MQILAHNAVHAAFAGYTGVTTGLVNTHYVLLPIPVVISTARRVRATARKNVLQGQQVSQRVFLQTQSSYCIRVKCA